MTNIGFTFNGNYQNNVEFIFFILLGVIYCSLFILHILRKARLGEVMVGVGGWGVNLDALSHGSAAAPGITHCQSTEAFNSFSCADMPVSLTPPSERDEQTLFPPSFTRCGSLSPLYPSSSIPCFSSLSLYVVFFFSPRFFLRGNGVRAGLRRPYRSADLEQ